MNVEHISFKYYPSVMGNMAIPHICFHLRKHASFSSKQKRASVETKSLIEFFLRHLTLCTYDKNH